MSGMVGWSSGEGRSMTRNGEARISHVPGVRIAQKRVWLKRRRKARACTYIGGSRAEHRESMTVLHWRVAPARVPAELSKVTASHQPWDSLPSLHFACAIALLYLSTAPSYSWARSKHTFPTTRNFRFHHFSVPFSLFSSSSASFEIFLTHNSSIDLDLISCPPPSPPPRLKKKIRIPTYLGYIIILAHYYRVSKVLLIFKKLQIFKIWFIYLFRRVHAHLARSLEFNLNRRWRARWRL